MRPLLDTQVFDRRQSEEEARRARKLERIYHVGQDKQWDGREVLSGLIATHGPLALDTAHRQALAKVLSALMWGELAAWKISAQLADRLEAFEAKMAATSQVHDEARHFYVLHDYLPRLGVKVPDLDRATRFMLESVLATDRLLEKLVGMQLYVENMALSLFKMLRQRNFDPVLSELLLYYERDEARHVGLGVQHAPALLADLGHRDAARLSAFQARIALASLGSLKNMEEALTTLGISRSTLADTGRALCFDSIAELIEASGGRRRSLVGGPFVDRSFVALKAIMFPDQDRAQSWAERLSHAAQALATPRPS